MAQLSDKQQAGGSIPPAPTHREFHGSNPAGVAQWKSACFVTRRSGFDSRPRLHPRRGHRRTTERSAVWPAHRCRRPGVTGSNPVVPTGPPWCNGTASLASNQRVEVRILPVVLAAVAARRSRVARLWEERAPSGVAQQEEHLVVTEGDGRSTRPAGAKGDRAWDGRDGLPPGLDSTPRPGCNGSDRPVVRRAPNAEKVRIPGSPQRTDAQRRATSRMPPEGGGTGSNPVGLPQRCPRFVLGTEALTVMQRVLTPQSSVRVVVVPPTEGGEQRCSTGLENRAGCMAQAAARWAHTSPTAAVVVESSRGSGRSDAQSEEFFGTRNCPRGVVQIELRTPWFSDRSSSGNAADAQPWPTSPVEREVVSSNLTAPSGA